MNIVSSLVESYMFADMYNREYDGGSSEIEKKMSAGLPVENIVQSIRNRDSGSLEQDGGNAHSTGPFANKVVPAGLILIPIHKDPDTEYMDYLHPGVRREVVPESLFDMLIGSVMKREQQSCRSTSCRSTSRRLMKDGSRKHKKLT